MVDRVARGRARAAVVAGDGNLVGAAFGNARGDGAHARERAQLHRHARAEIGVLQVEDEFGQVLDRVNIMVRRRGNEPHTWGGATYLGDPGVHLLARQVPAFARLCALRHLDLDFDGGREVTTRHAEAARRHLFDGAALAVTVGKRRLTSGVLTAFTRVRLAAEAVHRDGQAFVRFLGNGAVAHGARVEALDDLACGLDLVDRHRGALRRKVEQVTQRDRAAGDMARGAVFLEHVVVALAHRTLEQVDRLGVDQVLLAVNWAPRGHAERGKLVGRRGFVERDSLVVALVQLALHAFHTKSADARGGMGEALADERVVEAQDLKDLRGMVTLHRGDAHLRHDGRDARGDRLIVVRDGGVAVHVELAALAQIADALVRHVRVDARGGIAHQAGEIVRAHRVAGLDKQIGIGAQTHVDQVVVHRSERKKARDGDFPLTRAVGQHDQVRAAAHGRFHVLAQCGERPFESALLSAARISAAEARRLEPDAVDRAQAVELVVGEHRAFEAHETAGVAAVFQKVAVVADVEHRRGDEAFAQRIDWRVRDLGKQLVEVVEEAARLLGEARKRRVGAHGRKRNRALVRHGADEFLDVVEVVTQLGHAAREGHARVLLSDGSSRLRQGQIVDREHFLAEPIAVGLLVRVAVANLIVPDDAPLVRVDLKHLARAEAPRLQDVLGVDVDRADLGRQDEPVLARDVVASRAQAVAVERGTQHAAVGERDGGRSVPRLHEHGLVGVVGAALLVDAVVVVPRLGDHHGDGAIERTAVHRQELEHVVQDGGVGTLAVDNRQDLLQVLAEHRAVELRLASTRPGNVAAQRVDLAVVDDVAVRMRALPRRRRVRGVARMHERKGGLDRRVVQVGEEAAHLGRHEHALVDDGAARHRAHVEDLVRERRVRVSRALDGAAAHIELALEILACGNVFRTTQKRLQDGRHARLRGTAQVVRINRHLAPEHQGHAALRAAFLEDALRVANARWIIVREEEHGNAVVAFPWQKLAFLLRFLAEEAVRNLEEHARTVAGVALKARASAVFQVDQHRQCVVQHGMAALALQVRQCADAARVVLV